MNTTTPLNEDERRILNRFGAITICRVASSRGDQDQYLEDHFGGMGTRSCTVTWPGIGRGHGPFALVRTRGIVVVRTEDWDIITGKVTQPVHVLTWKRIREWVATISDELAERCAVASYGYANHTACAELAELLLAPTTLTETEELTLW
ncbi:hypothetical protein [Rhodococcus zopfii]|uniref:hypothetical protein n=1 Tax=Rhodococcus zopfii TaxID=43772 RepID=UPI0009343B81|nr:hypothetical protein [Rhodococcus zopfii]